MKERVILLPARKLGRWARASASPDKAAGARVFGDCLEVLLDVPFAQDREPPKLRQIGKLILEAVLPPPLRVEAEASRRRAPDRIECLELEPRDLPGIGNPSIKLLPFGKELEAPAQADADNRPRQAR